MKKDSGKLPKEKPIVIVRRKAGTKTSPSVSTQPPPKASPPEAKITAPASPPAPTKPQQPVRQTPPPAPVLTGAEPNRKELGKQARRELLEVLRERWPQAFPRDYRQLKPLAIGISKDIAAHLPEHPLRRIGDTIGIFKFLTGPLYYRVVLQGGPRYDLEGNPRGEVTLEEQEKTKQDLQAFYERRKRRTAPRTPAPLEDIPVTAVDGNKK